mmetsp:Transcript_85474/g.135538  ORF Transcript_85474/g.135538 Transcript_85474/m.135538 type:complete len:207 (+) Transcript_85474:875-1495(+)
MRQSSLSARQKWCRKRATNGAAKATLGQSSEGSEPPGFPSAASALRSSRSTRCASARRRQSSRTRPGISAGTLEFGSFGQILCNCSASSWVKFCRNGSMMKRKRFIPTALLRGGSCVHSSSRSRMWMSWHFEPYEKTASRAASVFSAMLTMFSRARRFSSSFWKSCSSANTLAKGPAFRSLCWDRSCTACWRRCTSCGTAGLQDCL